MNTLQTAQTNYTAAKAAYDAMLNEFHAIVTPFENGDYSEEKVELVTAEAYAYVDYSGALEDLRAAEEALIALAFTTLRAQLDWGHKELLTLLSENLTNLSYRRRVIALCMKVQS